MGYIKHREKVMRAYSAKCWICGRIGSEIDHVVPQSLGGSNNFANLRPICKGCNKKRNQKDHPYGYRTIPPVERVVERGSIWIYRRKIEVVPKMYVKGPWLLGERTRQERAGGPSASTEEARLARTPRRAARPTEVRGIRHLNRTALNLNPPMGDGLRV